MKKVYLLGAAALFSLALVVSSCSDDKDEVCVQCMDGEVELEYCYEEGNLVDAFSASVEFGLEHLNAVCEE